LKERGWKEFTRPTTGTITEGRRKSRAIATWEDKTGTEKTSTYALPIGKRKEETNWALKIYD